MGEGGCADGCLWVNLNPAGVSAPGSCKVNFKGRMRRLNNPTCPRCQHVFSWLAALKQILGPGRNGPALWGAVCPSCRTALKVPKGRMMLIVASAIFFGSQSSTLFVLGSMSRWQGYAGQIFLVIGFYVIATFFFLKLEPVE